MWVCDSSILFPYETKNVETVASSQEHLSLLFIVANVSLEVLGTNGKQNERFLFLRKLYSGWMNIRYFHSKSASLVALGFRYIEVFK